MSLPLVGDDPMMMLDGGAAHGGATEEDRGG